GKLSIGTSTVSGSQSIDLPYSGTSLPFNGSTYYWRIKFWDDEDSAGPWSGGSDTFTMADDGKLLQDFSYPYDAAGNITQTQDSATIDTPKTITYTYDDLYRLTSATSTATTSSQIYARSYEYDKLGNITRSSDQGVFSYLGNTGSSYANPDAVTA